MKKFVLSLVALVSIITLAGCGVKDTRKEVVITDTGFGTTTLKYDENKDYTVKTNEGGKYTEVVIKSVTDNFEIELYHTDVTASLYASTKENRKENSEGYQEFKWNNYEGYIYNADKYSLKFLIKYDDKHALFGDVSAYNYNSANMLEDFKGESIQALLNSVNFKEN